MTINLEGATQQSIVCRLGLIQDYLTQIIMRVNDTAARSELTNARTRLERAKSILGKEVPNV